MENIQHPADVAAAVSDARIWAQILARYRKPSRARSTFEIVITVVPLVLLWILMWATLDLGYWFCLLLAVPAAGFLVRLFMIQHDCGHGAFFHHRLANDWVGRVIGVLTLTPYDFWRRTHAIHHASSGNLDRRGIGDIRTLTVQEYLALSRWGRLRYRLYRHPIVMFGLGPAYLFILRHRLPIGVMCGGCQPWLSTMATNAAIAALVAIVIWFVGVGPFLLVHLPIAFLAASIGVWLFYVQHQFEGTFWAEDWAWNLHAAALHGSSHYDLPGILRWFTANIGESHTTGCPTCCANTLSLLLQVDSRSSKAFAACASCFGTRTGGGSFRFVTWAVVTSVIAKSVRTITDRTTHGEKLAHPGPMTGAITS